MHLNKDLDNSEMCSELHISIPFIVDSCSQIPFKVIKVSFVLNSCENKNYISELSKGWGQEYGKQGKGEKEP
jgi:hypothetical protein